MLGSFLHWWIAQLLAIVPGRWRRQAMRQRDATVIDSSAADRLALLRRRHGREAMLHAGSAASADLPLRLQHYLKRRPNREPVILRVPPQDFLYFDLEMPLAIEHDLQGALRYDIERQTPFAVEEVVWGYNIRRRDTLRKRLLLRLMLVPRERAAALARFGIASSRRLWGVEADTDEGRATLWPVEASGYASHARMIVMAGRCVVFALAICAVAGPFVRQGFELAVAERNLQSLNGQVREADILTRNVDGQRAVASALAGVEAQSVDVLMALSMITQVLPDESYLTELRITQGNVEITGAARSAAAILGRLAGDDRFGAPVFAAPVVTNPNSGRELFVIKAGLRL